MIFQKTIVLPAFQRGFHLITSYISEELDETNHSGLLNIFIHHTSAGLSINENADPRVTHDLEISFNKLAPENDPDFLHTAEGPDDMPAHIKTSLVGSSLNIPIKNGKLMLGTWQGIFLCEFRNHGGSRRLTLTLT